MKPLTKGISFRLAKVGVILAFALGAIMSTAQLYFDYQGQEKELQALVDRVIEVATPPAARAVHTLDDQLSAEVVDGLLTYDFIFEVSIVDELGNILATASAERKPLTSRWLTQYISGDHRQYTAKLTIPGYADVVSGQLEFKVDLGIALEPFYNRSVFIILSGMVRNTFLVLLLFCAFYFLLTRPLIRIVREIQEIDPENPAEQRLTAFPPNHQDELAQLVLNTNLLLESTEKSLIQRQKVENSLRESQEMVSEVVDNLPALVALLNFEDQFVFCNLAFAEFHGFSKENLLGKQLRDIPTISESDAADFLRLQRVLNRGQQKSKTLEMYTHSASGKRHYLQARLKLIELDQQQLMLVVVNDMTDRKVAEDKMQYMAYHDALTNLPNRLYLTERLEYEIARAKRYDYFGAVLFIDLDHFKSINDSLGHPIGDVVLKEISSRLQACVRQEDLVVRLSGDEFVIALTILDTEVEKAALKAGEIAEKIRKDVARRLNLEGISLHISCSIGIAIFNDNEQSSAHELLRFADTAMYQVKEKGRDAIEFFNSSMADKVSRQLLMEGELHKAFENNEFELFYQAKYAAKEHRIIGAEALIRWHHPERGMVSPAEFIPVMEDSGLILDVGFWVIEQACKMLQQWAADGLWQPGMQLSINISPRQFRRLGFVDDVKSILQKIPIPANSLDMEITEGIVIHNIEETIATLSGLADEGITFSLDDFGTGYSSISYLKRLPVSCLKIDYTFVRDITTDRSDRVLVETIITMAHMLGLTVIAEGVETAEQEEILRQYHCDGYQGYYFSRPIPAAEYVDLLKEACRSVIN